MFYNVDLSTKPAATPRPPRGRNDSAWQDVFGVSIVGIVPVVIPFALVEKRLVAGLTAGAVK
nr:hypothetical protein [Phytoactinopolyspora mesophila]